MSFLDFNYRVTANDPIRLRESGSVSERVKVLNSVVIDPTNDSHECSSYLAQLPCTVLSMAWQA